MKTCHPETTYLSYNIMPRHNPKEDSYFGQAFISAVHKSRVPGRRGD